MRVGFDAEVLKRTASDMEPFMKGNPLPMLDGLLITAKDGVITLLVNNLNLAVKKRLSGDVLLEGKALLHRKDVSLLRKMSGGMELEFSGGYCTARGNRVFTFPVDGSADDFPEMPEILPDSPDYTIPEDELLYCLKLRKLMANDDLHRQLCGLWIDESNILACNGYMLGKIQTDHRSEKRFMVPDYALDFLAKALDKKSKAPVSFFVSDDGTVHATSDGFEIMFRQYEGHFLSYERMFDTGGAKTVTVRKQEIVSAISFICDIGKSDSRQKSRYPVRYIFHDGRIGLKYVAEKKRVDEEIAFIGNAADIDITIGFNPFLNRTLLSMVDGDELTMSIRTPTAPSIIRGANEKEQYLLLPINLGEAA